MAATRAAFIGAPLDSFRVLHVATHAVVDDWHPEASLIVLAADGADNGYVSANQLAAMRIPVDLVVLTACRSAGGPIVGGEGVRGLAAPLLQAGARAVLATLWDVGDRAALDAMTLFYGELAAGRASDDALARTQRELRRRGAPAREWAAYTLLGDGSVRLTESVRRPWYRRVLSVRR